MESVKTVDFNNLFMNQYQELQEEELMAIEAGGISQALSKLAPAFELAGSLFGFGGKMVYYYK